MPESELDAFIFIEDLEGRLTAGFTAAGLKETASCVIDEMMEEEPVAISHDGGKTWIPLEHGDDPGGGARRDEGPAP